VSSRRLGCGYRATFAAIATGTCNIDATVLDCKFQLSKPLASVERMFENQPAWRVQAGSDSWQILYEPFEAHVFRIRTK